MIARRVSKSENDRQRELPEVPRQILLIEEDGRLVGFDAPGDCLPSNCPECVLGKRLRARRVLFGLLRHLTHRDDNLGEWSSAQLFSRSEYVENREIGAVSLKGYSLDDDWEAVPGSWVQQVWYGDTLLAEKRFTLMKSCSPVSMLLGRTCGSPVAASKPVTMRRDCG